MKQTEIDLLQTKSAKPAPANKEPKAEEEFSAEDIQAPKSKMKKIIILGLAALVVLGGGFVAAAYLGYIPVSIPGISPKEEPEKVEKRPPPEVTVGPMVKIKSLVLNLKDERKRNLVKITIVMEVAKAEWAEEVNKKVPALTDIMILTFSDIRLEELKAPGARDKLKKEFLARFNQALESEKIRGIYFDEFLFQ
jgi:flagellar protein FliL